MEIKFANKKVEQQFLRFLSEREFTSPFEFFIESFEDRKEEYEDSDGKIKKLNIKEIFITKDGRAKLK